MSDRDFARSRREGASHPSGAWVGGVVALGYLLDPEKGLVINEDEALIVREMFQMYSFGHDGTGPRS